MSKRVFTLALAIILGTTVMLGCGGGSESKQPQQETSAGVQNETKAEENADSVEEVVEPLDLTGNWAQKGKEGSDSFQAGYIKDGVIELFWISDGGDTNMLYWSGSYEAPTSADDEYAWESVNDKIKTDSALMASGDDTKTFNYKNGEISYEVSIMGQTGTITLVRSDNDYTSFAPAGGSSGEAQDGQQIELVESGYSLDASDGYVSVYYADFVDAIVNSAGNPSDGGSGVNNAIHKAAGPKLAAAYKKHKECKTGEAIITSAYLLPCKKVIHTKGPVWAGGNNNEVKLLADCYKNSLRIARDYPEYVGPPKNPAMEMAPGIRRIAFPSISTGIHGCPLKKAAYTAVHCHQ